MEGLESAKPRTSMEEVVAFIGEGKQALSREHARGLKDVYGGKEWVRGGMAEEGAWGGAGQVDAMTLTLSLSQMGND